jgi:hypothetical protein
MGRVLSGTASAAPRDPVNHGISFTKGCSSPTAVGNPYTCTYSIRNSVDDAQDTLTITGLSDTVHAAGGDVPSGNVFSSLRFEIAAGSPTCVGGTGNGSAANPFTGATSCILPFGSRLNVQPFSFYTVQAADFGLPGHALTDSAELSWHDLCNDPAGTGNSNCAANPPNSGAGSQTIVNGLPSTTTTTIHNAAHAPVTTVAVGTTVHDLVSVSGGAGNPVPTGNVTIDWFLNGACTGAPATNSGSVGPLNASGEFDATGFAFTVNSAGQRSFKAHYLGDATYLASDGPCEPLNVVDANIQITPANATNPVGTNHVLTITVNAVGGTIDAGPHTATASIVSGPGSFVGGVNTCTYTGGAASASCTVTITSATPGTTVVSATSAIPVSGLPVTRTTDGTGSNSGPAQKLWIQLNANVRTDVHNAAHGVITTAQAGDVVHDKAFVTKAPGTPAAAPNPTGTVTFHRYTSLNCSGAAVDQTVPLAADGTAESGTFTFTSDMSYRAVYSGDANYPAATGACEPLALEQSVCPSCPPPPCPAFPVFPGQPGPGGPCSFDVLDRDMKGTLVEITIQNNSSNGDAAMTKLHISWPASNGALKSVSMNGYLYTGPALTGGSADLTFTTDPLTRTIKVGQSQKLRLIFEKTADTNAAHYTGSVDFGSCSTAIF